MKKILLIGLALALSGVEGVVANADTLYTKPELDAMFDGSKGVKGGLTAEIHDHHWDYDHHYHGGHHEWDHHRRPEPSRPPVHRPTPPARGGNGDAPRWGLLAAMAGALLGLILLIAIL